MRNSDYQYNTKLRKVAEMALVAALRELYEGEIVHKVHSSNVAHTDLQPAGDRFSIQVVIEIQEKPA